MRNRLNVVVSVFGKAFGNPTLRRVGFAYALFASAEFGIWIALLVFAYSHGGASASTTIVLIQLIPCIVLAPFVGAFVDRRCPSTVLRIGYGFQAASLAGVAAAIGLDAPPWVVFVLAPLTAISLTLTRSPQAAMLPSIVRTPDELTAANAMTGWTDGAASLAGPALVGVLIALGGLTAAVAATSVLSFVALVLTAGLSGPAPAISAGGSVEDIWVGAGRNLTAAAREPTDQGFACVALLLFRRYRIARPALRDPRRGLPAYGSRRSRLPERCVRCRRALRGALHHVPRGPAPPLSHADCSPIGRCDLSRTHRIVPQRRCRGVPHCWYGSRRRRLRHHGSDATAAVGPIRGDRRRVFDSGVADGFRSRHGRRRGPGRAGHRWHPGRAR